MNWALLQNSLWVGVLSTALAVASGSLAALCAASLNSRWRGVCLCGAIVTLALPPFLVTNCWLYLLGHTGVWRTWLPLSIYSLGGTVWILALMNWPITMFLVLGAWQRIEPGQLENEPKMRGWPMMRWLLFPMAKPALGLSALLTFVLTINNFGIPSLLQTKVFAAELWVDFSTTFSYWDALRLGWPLALGPILLLLWLNRRGIAWPAVEGSVSSRLFKNRLGQNWFLTSGLFMCVLVFFAAGIPLGQLFGSTRTWAELPSAFAAGKAAFENSIFFAAISASVAVVVGLMCWRWRLGYLLWIPFLVPGVLLGIILIFTLNRPLFTAFYQSVGLVIFGFAIRYVALGWSGARHALQAADPDLTSAAKLEGASPWQILWQIHWPQIASMMAGVWYVIYLLCLWDVETLVLIVPPGAETLALRIFNLLHYGHNDQVNALCALLLILALAPLFLWRIAGKIRKGGFVGPQLFKTATSLTAGANRLFQTLILFASRKGQGSSTSLRPVAKFSSAALICFIAGCSPTTSNDAVAQSQIFSSVHLIGSRGTGLGQFNKPRSVAVDAQDNLYVVDMTGRVQKFSPAGTFLSSWQMPQTDLGKPKGMCRDRDGNIVVIEPHYSRVNHYSLGGKLMAQWGDRGTNRGQLMFPRAAVVNSRGEIFVSEYGKSERVQKFSALGREFLQEIGQGGPENGCFNRAEGLGIDRQDRLYVADSCNHRIQIFSATGEFITSYGHAGDGPGELSYPYDIQVDAEGRQYVCEFGNSRIQIFDSQNRSLEIIGGPGSALGRFNNPWSLALDSKGNLYVADSQNHRVQKFLRKTSA